MTEAESGPVWVQTMIYFGQDIPGGGVVSKEKFEGFLEEVLTREFPKGLTAFDSYGQMQHDDGSLEKQTTKVVLLVHGNSAAEKEAVKRVIDSYRSRFGAPQVMCTTSPIEVDFFQGGPA